MATSGSALQSAAKLLARLRSSRPQLTRRWAGILIGFLSLGVTANAWLTPESVGPVLALVLPVLFVPLVVASLVLSWRQQLWLMAATYPAVLATLVILILVWASLAAPIEERQREPRLLENSDTSRIALDAPSYLPATGGTMPITVTVWAAQPPTQPFTVTLDPDASATLSLIGHSDEMARVIANDKSVALMLPQTSGSYTAVIGLRNTLAEVGSLAPWVAVPERHVTIAVGADEPSLISVSIETLGRAALRSFVATDLGERSPLLLAAAALVAGVVWLNNQRGQQIKDAREEQARLDQAAREKQARCEQQARDLVNKARAELRDGRLEEARQTVQRLQQLPTVADPVALAQLTSLLTYVETHTPGGEFDTLPQLWPDEVMGVLSRLADQIAGDANRQAELRRAIRLLPRQDLSPVSRDRLRTLRTQLRIMNPRSRAWPFDRDEQRANRNSPPRTVRDLNILPAYKAEDDHQLFMKGNSTFFRHTLYMTLAQQSSATIIWGERGAGHTALARRMSLYDTSTTIGCYCQGQPADHEVAQALTRQLLRYICLNPLELTELGEAECSFIAGYCASHLGVPFVLALIDRAAYIATQDSSGSKASSEQQRIAEITVQMAWFRQHVLRIEKPFGLDAATWPILLWEAASLLGFKVVRVALDTGMRVQQQWLESMMITSIPRWTNAKLSTALFLISSTQPDLGASLNLHKLAWSSDASADDSLVKMLVSRFGAIFETRTKKLINYFQEETDGLLTLAQLSRLNPGLTAFLWRQIMTEHGHQSKITKEDIAKLAERTLPPLPVV